MRAARYVENNRQQMNSIHASVQRSNLVIGSLAARSSEIGSILK